MPWAPSASSATTATPALLDAAIVLSQPAVQHPRAPLVIPWSSGAQSTASQLDDTANSTVSEEVGTPAGDEGPLADLFRLALPAGLGEQGPLIESGLPAVRLSSDGELPINPSEDTPERFSTDTFVALRPERALADPRPRCLTRRGSAWPGGLHRRGGEPAAGLDDRSARPFAARPRGPRRRLRARLLGPQSGPGRARRTLGGAQSPALPWGPGRPARDGPGRPTAEPGLPIRSAHRVARAGRDDRCGDCGALLLHGRLLPAPTPPAAACRRVGRRSRRPADRRLRDACRLGAQSLSGAAGRGRTAGLALGGGAAAGRAAGRRRG